jgi:hypothetical protein
VRGLGVLLALLALAAAVATGYGAYQAGGLAIVRDGILDPWYMSAVGIGLLALAYLVRR